LWHWRSDVLDASKHTIVQVAVYNYKAIKFYKSFGFMDTGKRISNPKLKMKSGAIISEMEMRREAILHSEQGYGDAVNPG